MDTSKTTIAGYATAAAAVFGAASGYLSGQMELVAAISIALSAIFTALGFKAAADSQPPK